ncbi:MAG: hypothetical protein RR060_06890 [Victivallaceae bacterium]
MKKLWSLLLVAVVMLFCGCVVFSLKPYYTERNKIDVPDEAVGFWRDADSNVIQFKSDGHAAYYSNDPNDPAKLVYQVVFFKVDNNLYLDGELRLNESQLKLGMAKFAVMPLHLLYKVEFGEKNLKLWVPDRKKLDKILATDTNLPFVTYQETPADTQNQADKIFNATGEEWERALKQYDIWSDEPLEYVKFDPAIFNAGQAAKSTKK